MAVNNNSGYHHEQEHEQEHKHELSGCEEQFGLLIQIVVHSHSPSQSQSLKEGVEKMFFSGPCPKSVTPCEQ